MSIEFLDPTHEEDSNDFALAKRLQTLKGTTVGILSNGKRSTKPFFDALEKELVEQHGVAEVIRRTKSNYSAPADPELLEEAAGWHALIAGVGD